jgi:hypothetical protein
MTYKDKVAKLMVTDTKPDDAALFKCVGANIIGSVQSSANLTVQSKYYKLTVN